MALQNIGQNLKVCHHLGYPIVIDVSISPRLTRYQVKSWINWVRICSPWGFVGTLSLEELSLCLLVFQHLCGSLNNYKIGHEYYFALLMCVQDVALTLYPRYGKEHEE